MALKTFRPYTPTNRYKEHPDLSALETLEVDDAVFALMATANVAAGDYTLVVAATAALFNIKQGLLGLFLGKRGEIGMLFVAVGGSVGAEGLECHDGLSGWQGKGGRRKGS